MPQESGGVLPANTREGFRSETLARFALSAFGPATSVEVADDHGIDLVCATSRRVGQRLHVGAGYLVQVKSDNIEHVEYVGDNVEAWLEGLGSPLLICRVAKDTTRIRLYSTWSIARVLLQIRAWGGAPAAFRLVMDAEVTVADPSPDAIPLGPPIVDFAVTELHYLERTKQLRSCIEEWVQMDTENIVRRRSGLAIARGYTKWEPNRRPSEYSSWYHPYFYSEKTAVEARRLILDCATLISLLGESDEKRVLASYAQTFCDVTQLSEWAKKSLGV